MTPDEYAVAAKQYRDNPLFVTQEALMWRLHGLIDEGRGDDEVADCFRDAMQEPWLKLSRAENDLIGELSGILNDAREEQETEVQP